jgi:hypothetical protein
VPETRIDDGGGDLPTDAAVTPAAVMAEVRRVTPGSGRFADPLGKLDDLWGALTRFRVSRADSDS